MFRFGAECYNTEKTDIMENENNSSTVVLVTGASGYLGAHCVKNLLSAGYFVRGTVRSLSNRVKVDPLKTLASQLPDNASQRLELVEADLLNAECWPNAVKGCTYVLHVASPFPIVADESTVSTAVDGTLNVLRACGKNTSNVQKVVLTSSCSAVNEGHENDDIFYNEDCWSLTDPTKVMPYPRSKTEAEKAAWNFVKNLSIEDNQFTLTCLNPTLIIGPVLIDTQGTSISLIRRFLSFEMPAFPALHFPLVDVRDVAEAHTRAMRITASDGKRILLSAQPSFWFRDIAKVIGGEFRRQGYFVPSIQVPYAVLWLYSFFDADARASLPRLNRQNKFDTSRAKSLLGMEFRKPEVSLIEMIYSMIERGILQKKSGYKGPPISIS